MADRLEKRSKSLARLAAVQTQMVRLAEWRLAAAERQCRDLAEDKARLHGYVVEAGPLGVPLAKAALRSLETFDRRLMAAEHDRVSHRVALTAATLRESVVTERAARVGREARRVADDRDLADMVDTWFAAKHARISLP